MTKLRFGTAGIPLSTPERNTLNGIAHVRALDLDAMELEFVRQVHITSAKAPAVREAAKRHNIRLTCHGQYYINLNSPEEEKITASKQRIFNAARIASLCGAKSMTFHAAYYMKCDPERVYEKVKEGVKEVINKLKDNGHSIMVRPETTGKPSQWGSVKEILRLSEEMEGVKPCIDFSHLYARRIGKLNSHAQFCEVLSSVEKSLGREGLNDMHMHISGIEYGPKGERNHLNLQQCEFNYKSLLKALKEFNCKGIVISESPNIEWDALRMKNEYEQFS